MNFIENFSVRKNRTWVKSVNYGSIRTDEWMHRVDVDLSFHSKSKTKSSNKYAPLFFLTIDVDSIRWQQLIAFIFLFKYWLLSSQICWFTCVKIESNLHRIRDEILNPFEERIRTISIQIFILSLDKYDFVDPSFNV